MRAFGAGSPQAAETVEGVATRSLEVTFKDAEAAHVQLRTGVDALWPGPGIPQRALFEEGAVKQPSGLADLLFA